MADGFVLDFTVYSAGPTISCFLSTRLASLHQAQLPQLFAEGFISVDGQIASANHVLAVGQKVAVSLSDHYEEPVDTHWRKLWEDDEILAVFKPHLLPVSRTTRNLYYTLISLVRRQTAYEDAHLLHRLDTETAGIILLAKNKVADKKWKPRLDKLISKKIYHAWVEGIPEWDELSYECELSEKVGSPIRSQMYVVDQAESDLYPKPKQSQTLFRVLRKEEGKSLIECELMTGRKHQIRAHLAHLDHPIIGDKIYSKGGQYYLKRLGKELGNADFAELGSEYQRLTAVRVDINPDDQSVIIRVDSRD
ncbi:RluA family pseudouridine synthase [Neptuniibacter sp. QD48_11]|uniref:RluA family pseudouridine synthase n=1 Tax=Neptuniibacter sp. QD48_11 TaxID=3398211 RepID=UPI0039F5783D